MRIDHLVVVGMATLQLGTILESDGVQCRTFTVCNDGDSPVTLLQGYTSCGCTTISFSKDSVLPPGDSSEVKLRFNPRGKAGEIYESGTVVYGDSRQSVQMAMEGCCITSEETLAKMFPIVIDDDLRISRNQFDLGFVHPGATKTVHVGVLHRHDGNRQQVVPVSYTVSPDMPAGVHHVDVPVSVDKGKHQVNFNVRLDVGIRK